MTFVNVSRWIKALLKCRLCTLMLLGSHFSYLFKKKSSFFHFVFFSYWCCIFSHLDLRWMWAQNHDVPYKVALDTSILCESWAFHIQRNIVSFYIHYSAHWWRNHLMVVHRYIHVEIWSLVCWDKLWRLILHGYCVSCRCELTVLRVWKLTIFGVTGECYLSLIFGRIRIKVLTDCQTSHTYTAGLNSGPCCVEVY